MTFNRRDHNAETERLNQVFDTSSEKNRNVMLGFLAAQLYILVIVGGTTDMHLLLSNTAFHLPVVNIGIPIVGFYIFAPLLLVVFHFNLLFNLSEHVDLLKRWQKTNHNSNTRFPYMINLIAYYQQQEQQHSRFKLYVIKAVAIFAMVVFPQFVLVLTLFWFADFHSLGISALHVVLIYIDLYVMKKYIGQLALPIFSLPSIRAAKYWFWSVILVVDVELLLLLVVMFAPVEAEKRFPLWLLPHIDVSEKEISQVKEEFKYSFSPQLLAATEQVWSLYQSVDLKGRHLALADLSDTTLYGVDLRQADLHGAKLFGAQLPGAKLSQANFTRASLDQANLSGAKGRKVDLSYANFTGANLSKTEFRYTKFAAATLNDSDLTQSRLYGVDFNGAVMNNAQLNSVTIGYSTFIAAVMGRTQWIGASISEVDFSLARLMSAQFHGAKLRSVDLAGAKLDRARLIGGYFDHVEFIAASIYYTDFTASEFITVDFTGAVLDQADFSAVVIKKATFALCGVRGLTTIKTQGLQSFDFDTCLAFPPADSNSLDHQQIKRLANGFRQLKDQLSDSIVDVELRKAAIKRIDTGKFKIANRSRQSISSPRLKLGFSVEEQDKLNAFHQQRREFACEYTKMAASLCAIHLDKSNPWRDSEFYQQVVDNPQCSINQDAGELAKGVCLGN